MPAHAEKRHTCPSCGYHEYYHELCSDRTCAFCASRRRRRLIKHYRPVAYVIGAMGGTFITLTCQRLAVSRENIRRVMRAWRVARRDTGSGMFQIELGTVRRAGGLKFASANVHIHILTDGHGPLIVARWLEAARAEGLTVSGLAQNAETVRSAHRAAEYLTKHMIKRAWKGPDDKWIRDEINRALRGVRLITLYGDFYRYRVHENAFDCPVCGGEMYSDSALIASEYGYNAGGMRPRGLGN